MMLQHIRKGQFNYGFQCKIALTLIYIRTVYGEPNIAILHNVYIQVLFKRYIQVLFKSYILYVLAF